MRQTFLSLCIGLLGFVMSGCGGSATAPVNFAPNVAAKSTPTVGSGLRNYNVVRIPTLGGTEAYATFIDAQGRVTGAADVKPAGSAEHAFLWDGDKTRDLGTLGGDNSESWGINGRSDIAGQSVTSTLDPNAEDFCQYVIDGVPKPTKNTCRGFRLSDGTKTPLSTLGGNNNQAFGLNNRGQIVGDAENSTLDPSCIAPQVLDYEAVMWSPDSRHAQMLSPYAGDAVGIALAVNDKGQVAGASGYCASVSFSIGVHALLWQSSSPGSPTYLGGFGGAMNNVAWALNNRGQVVGFSDLPGDATTHAFLWKKGTRIVDLGTLPGDLFSFAFGINERGKVVGMSCDASFNCRAFIWQRGVMTDLNTLIPSSSTLYLTIGASINNAGQITGYGFEQSTGDLPAYVATPTDRRGAHPSVRVTLPANVRAQLKQRIRF